MSRDAILRFPFFFHPSWNTTKLTNQLSNSSRFRAGKFRLPPRYTCRRIHGLPERWPGFLVRRRRRHLIDPRPRISGARRGEGSGGGFIHAAARWKGGGRRIYLGRAGPLSARDVRACTQLSRGSRRLSPRSSHELETESGRGEWRSEGGREGGGPWGLMNDAGGWPRPR